MDGRLSEQDERHREREFYKYYEPIRALADKEVAVVDLFDRQAAEQHKPRSCPDAALTAFCQLGALRVNTRRCMLFFFDRDNAYVLAEATQTLSLQDDSIHDVDDELWLGHVVIPRGLSVCEHTVLIPDYNDGSNKDEPNAGVVHIINDLTGDVRFCDRPYVTDGPRARFYAGVPIITPSGTRIGAFCVLDDKPRTDVKDKHVDFLVQMSKTIMDHLENVRARSEYARGANMLTSMGTFFNTAPVPDVRTGGQSSRTGTPTTRNLDTPITSPGPIESRTEYFAAAPLVQSDGRNNEPSLSFVQATTTPAPTATTGFQDHAYGGSPMPMLSPKHVVQQDFADSASEQVTKKDLQLDNELEDSLNTSIKRTFQLAAELIRKAANVDGIHFIDTANNLAATTTLRRRSRARASDDSAAYTDTLTDTTGTDGTVLTDSEEGVLELLPPGGMLLGQSERRSSDTLKHASFSRVPKRLLRRLLRRYPNGNVWNFTSDGDASATESLTEYSDAGAEVSSTNSSKRSSRQSDAAELQQIFPNARAICFFGLYDPSRDRPYAAAIMWSFSTLRVFTLQGDLNYLRAFCDVIMANVSRIEARVDLQSKSQFISSISHELRSPLHGILGSIDFLREQNEIDWSIISQVERCSITLVDVIEHLLVFAKVNHQREGKNQFRVRGSASKMTQDLSPLNASSSKEKSQSLAKMTEDVADAIYHSHCCTVEDDRLTNVRFILDVRIDLRQECRIPIGAWKRICMNIINNALKYTQKGYVMVSLHTSKKNRKRPVAVLTVTDTGCGMSKHFLHNQLFRAFSQENSLSVGTGLGMSLVAKLIKSMSGQIDVKSIKNVGTTVEITVPLQKQDLVKDENAGAHNGMRARILHAPSVVEDADREKVTRLRWTAIADACSQIGVSLVEDGEDLELIFEADLPRILRPDSPAKLVSQKPLVVLCDTLISASTLRQSTLAESLERKVEFIAQPFGPHRLAQAIEDIKAQRTSPETKSAAGNQADATKSSTKRAEFNGGRLLRRSSSWMDVFLPEQVAASRTHRKARAQEFLAIMEQPNDLSKDAENENPEATPSPRLALSPESSEDRPEVFAKMIDEAAQVSEDASIPTPVDAESAGMTSMSLLLVDDNRINLRILKLYAERNQQDHEIAMNGQEAVDAYMNRAKEAMASKLSQTPATIDVVFMDINMPVMDGFEATRAIRVFEKSHDLRPATIIALTGLGSASAQQTAQASGVDIFLMKPLRPRDMNKLLRDIYSARRAGADTTSLPLLQNKMNGLLQLP